MQVLLSLLALHARDLKPGTAADMVCFMEHYGVDSDEPTMQVFLQLAKFFINDLTLDRVVQVSEGVQLLSCQVNFAPLDDFCVCTFNVPWKIDTRNYFNNLFMNSNSLCSFGVNAK